MKNDDNPPEPQAKKKGNTTKAGASAQPPKGKADHLEGHQWSKGCESPNPKGRPKGSKNTKTIVKEAFLKASIEVPVAGKKKKMSKHEVAIHQIGNLAAKGDLKAADRMFDLIERYGDVEETEPSAQQHQVNLDVLHHVAALFAKFHPNGFPKEDVQ